jgi:hypothetical protein
MLVETMDTSLIIKAGCIGLPASPKPNTGETTIDVSTAWIVGGVAINKGRSAKRTGLYGKCPKLVKIESLNKPIADSEGNLTEFGELIADDKALDLDAWLDYKTFLLTSPERLILIGEKIRDRIALTRAEQKYIERFRKQEQKKLFQDVAF